MQKNNSRVVKNGTTISLLPKGNHQETVIWIHGLGDTPMGFLSYFINDDYTPFPQTTKVVLPEAPVKKVTANYGMPCTSWFDIKTFDKSGLKFEQTVSIEDIKESENTLRQILNEEIKILGNSKKVFIGGFSQGCCVSLFAGLQYPERIGGIIGASGYYFPITQIHQSNKDTPVFLTHGKNDSLIQYKWAQESYEPLINSKDQRLIFECISEAGIGHEVSALTLKNIKQFFQKANEKNQ